MNLVHKLSVYSRDKFCQELSKFDGEFLLGVIPTIAACSMAEQLQKVGLSY